MDIFNLLGYEVTKPYSKVSTTGLLFALIKDTTISLRGLVLANGQITECRIGDEELYLPIILKLGQLYAGGSSTRLVIQSSVIRQAVSGEIITV